MGLAGRFQEPHLAGREVKGKVNTGPEDTPLAEGPSLSLHHLSLWSFSPYSPLSYIKGTV